MTETFTTALIASPYGLKGFVKVRSLSGEYEHLAALSSATLRQGQSSRVYEIEETAFVSSTLVMKFKGINSPEEAKKLGGAELVVERGQAAALEGDEYYIEDLKGLRVVLPASDAAAGDSEPELIGEITDVMEGGGGHLAEIRLHSGAFRLVPFRNEFFGAVDLEKGRVPLLAAWILE